MSSTKEPFDSSNDTMDFENRQRTERLAQKISHLKNFAIDIEDETKEHNKLLNSLDNDFDSNMGFLMGGRNRVNRLLQQGSRNRRFMCYVSAIVSVFLIIIYYLISKSLFSS